MGKSKQTQPLNEEESEYVWRVYEETSKSISKFCRYLTENEEDAADLSQETYCRFAKRVPEKGKVEVESKYLRRIAENAERNKHRGYKPIVVAITENINEHDEDDHGEESSLIDALDFKRYQEQQIEESAREYFEQFKGLLPLIRSKLTPEEHELICLRYGEGRPYEEIAYATGQSHEQVVYRTNRAISKARYWAKILIKRQHH